MRGEQALKVVLVVVGLLFCAGVYPLILSTRHALGMRRLPDPQLCTIAGIATRDGGGCCAL
jgi:hypothetical protein